MITVIHTIYKFAVCRVSRIGPDASRIDAEFAVTVTACNISLDNEGIGAVHIRGGQLTGSRQDSIGFREKCGVCARNDGCIVTAGDIDRNELAGAIGGSDGDAIRVGDTCNKLIVGCVGDISPDPLRIDTELAITMTAFNSSLSHKGIRAVHVGC